MSLVDLHPLWALFFLMMSFVGMALFVYILWGIFEDLLYIIIKTILEWRKYGKKKKNGRKLF